MSSGAARGSIDTTVLELPNIYQYITPATPATVPQAVIDSGLVPSCRHMHARTTRQLGPADTLHVMSNVSTSTK